MHYYTYYYYPTSDYIYKYYNFKIVIASGNSVIST